MIRSSVVLLFVLCLSFLSQAQSPTNDCHCADDFAFVTNYLENHYSGFESNVKTSNRTAYDQLKSSLAKQVNQPLNHIQCLQLLKQYTSFFRDHHLSMVIGSQSPAVNEKDAETVEKFKQSAVFKDCERVPMDSSAIYAYLATSTDPIEGVYDEANYRIAVMKNKTALRDYYGIVLKSKTPLWEKGQVKMEIKQLSDTSYQSLLYMRNHSVNAGTFANTNPVTALFAAIKIFPREQGGGTTIDYSMPMRRDWFVFQNLDDSTNYVYIGTFDGALRGKFDSAYKAIMPQLKQRPNLIIDVRSNGGGSDMCWRELAHLMYTQPFQLDHWEYFSSSEIIKRYQEILAKVKKDPKAYGKGIARHYQHVLKLLKKGKPGTFVSAGNPGKYINIAVAKPKRIILMYNRQSASSAEGLILQGLHSNKVLTFGENSGGYIAFGNIMTVRTPSGFLLNSGTHRVPARVQYEMTGIPPKVKANPSEDWIEQARKLWGKVN
ncbi:MAG TPA: hypothetical protein DGG95_16490 [Cytophagales bacterium]|jgi:hypothetical protein|nr:hypothetical protein [Cytophagales bacterium]